MSLAIDLHEWMIQDSSIEDLTPFHVLNWPFPGMAEGIEAIEVQMLRQIALGDQQAFAQLYDRFSGISFTVALKILNDRKEAEDVLQEVFLQIWAKAAGFDPNLGKPLSWIVTLTRNRAIDRLRSSQRRYRLVEELIAAHEDPPQPEASSPHAIQSGERAALTRAAMAALPADQRQAIELAFFGGLTQTDIAELLQQPLGTIKARIRRGLLKLRDALEKVL